MPRVQPDNMARRQSFDVSAGQHASDQLPSELLATDRAFTPHSTIHACAHTACSACCARWALRTLSPAEDQQPACSKSRTTRR